MRAVVFACLTIFGIVHAASAEPVAAATDPQLAVESVTESSAPQREQDSKDKQIERKVDLQLAKTRQSIVGGAVPATGELANRGSKALFYGLAAFFIGIACYKRFADRLSPGAAGSVEITIVAKRQLSPKHSIYLVNVRGREMLLGTGSEGITQLATFESSQEPPFSNELARALADTDLPRRLGNDGSRSHG